MRIIHKCWDSSPGLFVVAVCCPHQTAQAQPSSERRRLAQKSKSQTYLSKLADVHCTETVIQEKLAENGHVEASAREQFDYLIMMSGHEDDFQLSESRIEAPGWRHKLLSTPMLLDKRNGDGILLVFHPYYRDSFNFQTAS